MFNKMQAGDRLLVDIDSQELWLKISLQMRCPDAMSFAAEFEIKIDRKTKGKELKIVIQKLSISLWNRLCSEDKSKNSTRSEKGNSIV